MLTLAKNEDLDEMPHDAAFHLAKTKIPSENILKPLNIQDLALYFISMRIIWRGISPGRIIIYLLQRNCGNRKRSYQSTNADQK